MTLEFIAVSGCVLGHKLGSLITGGVFVIVSVPSIKVLATAGVYETPLTFTFSGGSSAGFDAGSIAGGGAIPATALKVLAEGLAVMREKDFVLMAAAGTIAGVPTPISGLVEIVSAGQTKVKAQ